MRERLNKRIAVILVVVGLVTFPLPSDVWAQNQRATPPSDGCVFAKRTGALAGVSAFAFGLMPGLQAVGVAYGAYAVGARLYTAFYCE